MNRVIQYRLRNDVDSDGGQPVTPPNDASSDEPRTNDEPHPNDGTTSGSEGVESPSASEADRSGVTPSTDAPTRAQKFSERQGSMKQMVISLLIVFVLLLIAVNLFL